MKILQYVETDTLSFRIPWVGLMKEMARRDVRQVVLCNPGGNMEEAARGAGLETYVWRPFSTKFPRFLPKFAEVVRDTAVDLIHTRLSDAAYVASFWGERLDVPTVAMFDKPAKARYYRRAFHYTSCSKWIKEHMVAQGIPADRIDVIYNSVDVAQYALNQGARKAFREEHGIAPNDMVFVGAGRFDVSKGFGMLIDAFAAVARIRPEVRLLLAGAGGERANYMKQLNALGVSDRAVVSEAFVPDIRPWLWASDVFVLPSKAEPFGIIIIEAMASGLPVVATSSGAPPEIISDGLSGLLTPPDDSEAMVSAMLAMIEMGEVSRKEMAATANTGLFRFTSEAVATTQIEVYEKVLELWRWRKNSAT